MVWKMPVSVSSQVTEFGWDIPLQYRSIRVMCHNSGSGVGATRLKNFTKCPAHAPRFSEPKQNFLKLDPGFSQKGETCFLLLDLCMLICRARRSAEASERASSLFCSHWIFRSFQGLHIPASQTAKQANMLVNRCGCFRN